MGLFSLKGWATLVLVFLVFVEVTNAARKRKPNHRDEQELDDFSGDSYSEFVDKFYKNSKVSSTDTSSKKGGNSR